MPSNQPTRVERPPVVQYWAISVLSSRTMWFNFASFLVAVLSLTEVVTLIPPRFMPVQAALTAIINLWLRSVTVRPAVWIAPGTTIPVQVQRLNPPQPTTPTD